MTLYRLGGRESEREREREREREGERERGGDLFVVRSVVVFLSPTTFWSTKDKAF